MQREMFDSRISPDRGYALSEQYHELSIEREQRAPQRKYGDQSRDGYANQLNVRHRGDVSQPIVRVTVTLREHSDHEAGYTQEVVAEFEDHRSDKFSKFRGDEYRVTANGEKDHNDERGDAQDRVNGTEVKCLHSIHYHHTADDTDQPENLQNPVNVSLGTPRKKVRQDAFTSQDDNGLRHQ